MLLFDEKNKSRVELNNRQVLKEIIPRITEKDITLLTKCAKDLHRLNTKYCNEKLTEKDKEDMNTIENIIKEKSKEYNISIAINYDPRGLPIRILNEKYRNTLDGDGYAILIKF